MRLVPFGGDRIRAVTHRNVNRDDVLHAAGVLSELLAARGAEAGS